MRNLDKLLIKLNALAQRGIGGEKANAKRMLFELMKKHGITFDQIEENEPKDSFFKTTLRTRAIFIQCARMITGSGHPIYGIRGSKTDYCVKCTISEKIEIETLYTFYKTRFEEDLKVFESAFIQKNHLFPADGKATSRSEMTNEDRKVLMMSEGLTEHHFRKQLNS